MLRYIFAIPLIVLGSILIGSTIHSIGEVGNSIIKIIGIGCIIVAILIARKKK